MYNTTCGTADEFAVLENRYSTKLLTTNLFSTTWSVIKTHALLHFHYHACGYCFSIDSKASRVFIASEKVWSQLRSEDLCNYCHRPTNLEPWSSYTGTPRRGPITSSTVGPQTLVMSQCIPLSFLLSFQILSHHCSLDPQRFAPSQFHSIAFVITASVIIIQLFRRTPRLTCCCRAICSC